MINPILLFFSRAAIPIRVWRCTVAPSMRKAVLRPISYGAMPCGKRWRAVTRKFSYPPVRKLAWPSQPLASLPAIPDCGRCLGPCVAGLVSEEGVCATGGYVRLFCPVPGRPSLNTADCPDGKGQRDLAFEEAAARIRDRIRAVRRVTEKQFVSAGDDLDVIGVAFDAGMACVRVLFIRRG